MTPYRSAANRAHRHPESAGSRRAARWLQRPVHPLRNVGGPRGPSGRLPRRLHLLLDFAPEWEDLGDLPEGAPRTATTGHSDGTVPEKAPNEARIDRNSLDLGKSKISAESRRIAPVLMRTRRVVTPNSKVAYLLLRAAPQMTPKVTKKAPRPPTSGSPAIRTPERMRRADGTNKI
jgi:hypothetical protein